MQLRRFIAVASSTLVVTSLLRCQPKIAANRALRFPSTRLKLKGYTDFPWLGPNLWANRLQDWRSRGGHIKCLADGEDLHVRTAHILTRSIVNDISLRVSRQRYRQSEMENSALVDFFWGPAALKLINKSAALIHYGPGVTGGLLIAINGKGALSLRDFNKLDRTAHLRKICFR